MARVLIGLDSSDTDDSALEEFTHSIGYSFVEETKNPVYEHFLR